MNASLVAASPTRHLGPLYSGKPTRRGREGGGGGAGEEQQRQPAEEEGDGRGVRFVHISWAALGGLTGFRSVYRAEEEEVPVSRLRLRLPFSSRRKKRTDGLEITRGRVIYLFIHIYKKKKKRKKIKAYVNPIGLTRGDRANSESMNIR